MKRILIISDTHCGHMSGLTPPGFQLPADSATRVRQHMAEFERRTWDWFAESVARVGKIDALVWNGDILDGKGERSGGTELIMSDRLEQIEMAERIVKLIGAPRVELIYGTPYHVGRDEDWEAVLAERLGCHIGSHEWLDAEGVVIDFKHKVSGSVIPHGRHTAPSRARLWNLLWADRELQPRADIVVRSHAHTFGYSGDARGLAIVTPGLQGWTKYGGRQCEGTVDYGFLTIDCEEGAYQWKPWLMDMRFSAATARTL